MAVKLTKSIADSATYAGTGNARQIIWDNQVPGLGLRVYPTGKKSFVLSYRHEGRKRLMTLGTYGVETVATARVNARKALAKLTTDGDPLTKRRRNNQANTLEAFCAVYMERHATVKKKRPADDQSLISNRIIPALGGLKLHSITREDVARLHQKIGTEQHIDKVGKPTGKTKTYLANRVLALLSKMFELAITWGYLPEAHGNPAKRIQKFSEIKRDRWVTPEELPRLAQAIDAEANPVARDALWLYLLTGLRKSELLSLRWSDIDLERSEIRLADTKAGRPHYLPLSGAASELLRNVTQLQRNNYVLPGKLEGAHLVNITKPWGRVRAAAGIEDVRLHDLRRTVGSWLAQSGNSLHLIGRVLNHSNASTTQVYARFGQDTVRAALDKHGAEIMGAAGKRKSAEVVKIGK